MEEVIDENIEVIKGENYSILYDRESGEYIRINKPAYDVYTLLKEKSQTEILNKFQGQKSIEKLLNIYRNKGILINKRKQKEDSLYKPKNINIEDIKNGFLVRALRLNITEKCNLDCTYCYEKVSNKHIKREMSWEVARNAIKNFFEIIERNNVNHCCIRFFGGEPLLKIELLTKCLMLCKSIADEHNIEVEYLLNTNGTLLNEEICKLLKQYNIHTILSLDGVQSINDIHRKFLTGVGSFTTIDKKIEYLYKENCTFNYTVVCTNDNYKELRSLIDYISNKGKKYGKEDCLSLNNIHICSRQGIVDMPVDEQVKYIIDTIKYAEIKGVKTYGGSVTMCYRHFVDKDVNSQYCAGIGNELCVQTNGDVWACEGNTIVLGNIEDINAVLTSEKYIEIATRDFNKNPECRNCRIKAYCCGGCLAEYLSDSGKKRNTNRDCELQIKLFQELVKHYVLS